MSERALLYPSGAVIDGIVRFFDLLSPGLDFAGSTLHQSLLAEYAKVRRAMQAAA